MLKRVSIQNFKSLKDVTLDLQKINLLIGPNNSGKTNFLKALEYLGYLKRANGTAMKPYDDITFMRKGGLITIEYIVRENYMQADMRSIIEANHEKLTETSPTIRFSHSYKGDLEGYESNFFPLQTAPLNALGIIGPIIIYRPDINKLSVPGPVGIGEEIINADASNLVGFLDLMLGKYRKTTFSRIETDLHTCLPEFDEIVLEDASPTEELKKQFCDKSFKRIGLTNSTQGVTYWTDELSEGTLYFLALLCIINQPNPPKLLLLEEPEKGIHPRRIREVMDFIRRLVSEKDIQVIMTTHSPLLLDQFAESPESVLVFDKDEEGATTVRNLRRDIIEPANLENERLGIPPVPYTEALGEYWTIGFLGGIPHETT